MEIPNLGKGPCPGTLGKSRAELGRNAANPPGNGKRGNYPSSERGPGGDASAEVPQHPDHDDARLQPVGPGLEAEPNQTGIHRAPARAADAPSRCCFAEGKAGAWARARSSEPRRDSRGSAEGWPKS